MTDVIQSKLGKTIIKSINELQNFKNEGLSCSIPSDHFDPYSSVNPLVFSDELRANEIITSSVVNKQEDFYELILKFDLESICSISIVNVNVQISVLNSIITRVVDYIEFSNSRCKQLINKINCRGWGIEEMTNTNER